MIAYFARHPTAANLLLLFICVLGLSSLPSLQRETFPRFASDLAEVRVVYPGASAEEVEEAVCQRIEDAVDSLSDISETRCEAREGVGRATLELREGGDRSRFLDDIKAEIDAIDSFPAEIELPMVRELNRTDRVISVAISGPMSPPDLRAYAEQVRASMQRHPGVPLVEVLGFSQRQLRIEVAATVMQRHGVALSDVANTIRRQGIDLPAGALEGGGRDQLIRFTDQRRTASELQELIVVGARSGAEVRLGDIATISDRFELDEEQMILNGERAALLQVVKTRDQDTLKVRDAVVAFVDQEQLRAPAGVHFALTEDRSSNVRDRLRLLTVNGLQGLLLVFLVMWLFFQGRFAFWVAMGLPVAFLGALFCMNLIGLTINMITMVALLIAIGLLMDDAIVISENIATHLRRGKGALAAAIDGTRQVAPGVIASFLTSVSVFLPLAFLSGHLGKVLQFIPMVLILVLAVSLIEAFLILPHHLEHSLRHHLHDDQARFRQRFDRVLERFRDYTLGRLVDLAIRHRYLFAGSVIALFIASLAMVAGGKLKFQSFPTIEGDIIEARLLMPQGTPLHRTQEVVGRIVDATDLLRQHYDPLQPAGSGLIRNLQVRYNANPDVSESGPHLATVTLDLITAEQRQGRLDDIIAMWREEVGVVADVVSLNFKEPVLGPGGVPLEIRLYGKDLESLKLASLELQEWFARYPGVTDLGDDLRPGKPELRLRLRPGAYALGIDATTVASQLRAAYFGTTITEIQIGAESWEIDLRLAANDRIDQSDLDRFRIVTASGDLVPITTVVTIEQARGYSRIQRINGIRTVTVQGDLDTRLANAREIIAHTRSTFLPGLEERYPGVRSGIEGQERETGKTMGSMVRGFAIGLIGIFILLSFQFRSYIEPVIVMSIIPLALIGVIWGHLLLGQPLSMPSIIGFTSLAGVVVNDSILLVEFIKLHLRDGVDAVEAACRASRERFRAVLLTSITTMAGLTPLLLERSLQAQVLIPLAISIVFGLLATTLLVLLMVPVLYNILDELGLTAAKRDSRK
jgi:HAE1 family hydrophobic/amphiphilic exporter-1